MVRNIQFHEFQDIEAHANGLDRVRFSATAARGASLGCFYHSVDKTIAHGGTVAFESVTNDDEES
jgi:hypothetical protein